MVSISNNNQIEDKYYVYGHFKSTDDTLFYIGVGTVLNNSKKETQRYSRAYHFSNRNQFWKNIKNKYGVKVRILSTHKTKIESLKKEAELVEKYGRKWLNTGILCNISSGGEIGPVGRTFKMSEEQKKLLSDIKSIPIYIYNSQGFFDKEIKTIESAAEYCNVTYNAIHTALNSKKHKTKDYCVFKEFQGSKIKIPKQSHTNAKEVVCIDEKDEEKIFESVLATSLHLKCARESVRDAIKRKGKCKGHIVYYKDNQQPSP